MKLFTLGMNYFRNCWNSLTNIGVDEEAGIDESRYVRFTNVIALLTALAVLSYIPYSIYKSQNVLAALQVIDAICVISVIWLNYRSWHMLSRQAYLFIINSFVLINAFFIGYQGHAQDFFYISYIVPFLLFRISDYKNILVGVLMAVLFFNIYEHFYPYFSSYNLDMATQKGIYEINTWMKFVLFGVAIYNLAFYNYQSEKELETSNNKLRAQAEELKRSNKDLEQFAYIISHDLKAPVRNISSFMKLLLSRYGDSVQPTAKEFIELSKTSAERLSKQIEDLLAYCKVGRNLPAASTVDLNDMVKTIRLELGEKLNEGRASIIVQRRLPMLKNVHLSMVHHVLQNLIANGIKFNTSKFPEIKIDFKQEQDCVRFMVTDNGIGIEPGYEARLFQMFQRLHNNDKFEGTGIGLAVCKKIVNFYGGQIGYESQPGEGTTFWFTLPKSYMAPHASKSSDLTTRAEISVAA
jgi:signal transduction histidine kinase